MEQLTPDQKQFVDSLKQYENYLSRIQRIVEGHYDKIFLYGQIQSCEKIRTQVYNQKNS